MSSIILPSRRIAQPNGLADINRKHWAGEHATRVIIPSASPRFDLANKVPVSLQENCSLKPGARGVGFWNSGSITGGFTVPSWVSTGEASLILVQQRNSTVNAGWMNVGTGADADHFQWSGTVYSDAFSSARWLFGASLPSGADATAVHVVGISSKAGSQRATFNGVQFATGASAFALEPTLTFGTSPAFGGFNGFTYEVYAFSKAFSTEELRILSQNPSQIFKPTNNRIWFDAAAGGGANSLSDYGSGSDAISISVAFGLSDAGAGNDLQPSPGAALSLLDDGACADSVSLAALLAVSDTGAGSDADTVSVAFALSDSGSGADAISILTQFLASVSDAASGVDGVSIQAQIALADSGSGADTPVLYISLYVADSASAADILDVLQQLLISVADAGAGLEGMAIAINVPVGDAGSGMDAPSIQAWLALVESATGMDASVAFNAGGQRIATILFKLAHRAMTFTLAARQISFTLN